jgi:hypothetical protein
MKYSYQITWFIILTLVASSVNSQSVVFIKYGECHKAMNYLKESVKNDSLAVSMFWDNYKVINKDIDFLKAKKPEKVIEFFNLKENKQLMCEHKRFTGSQVLLVDSVAKE